MSKVVSGLSGSFAISASFSRSAVTLHVGAKTGWTSVFAIGMVEDVIDALSQAANLRVISSSATARFLTGALPDVEAIGKQLGVRYLLEGNVRRAGADLRVTAQLVEAETGAIAWTQRFDRPLAELAALQEALVKEVAVRLDVTVRDLEMARAQREP
jgi:TolB-like protein